MSIFSQLFGKKPSATCKKCGNKGNLFLQGGAYEGSFKTIGKDSRAWLIIQCIKCGSEYTYDPIWGKIEEYNQLKMIAKEEFGIDVDKNRADNDNVFDKELKEYEKKEKDKENKKIAKAIERHKKRAKANNDY